MDRTGIRAGVRDGVGLIGLSAGPGNLLDAPLVAALGATLDEKIATPRLTAIVIFSDGPQFSLGSGADSAAPAALGAVLAAMDRATVPVIAALSGPAVGSGAALAIAAHYRLAIEAAWLSLPEVTIGLLPPAGTLQRLTRIVGAAQALELASTGRRIGAVQGQAAGLIDGIVDGDPASGALRYALALTERGQGARAAPGRPLAAAPAAMAAVQAARARPRTTQSIAPGRITDCIEAAYILPWEVALTYEAEAEAEARADPPGRALRHLSRAERMLPPAFLTRDATGRPGLTPEGLAIAGDFRAAWIMAARALVQDGRTEAAVDAAALAWGHATGPFGGTAVGTDGADPAITDRLLAALLAEAARQVASGRLTGPDAADALAVAATGFPRWRGGPAFAAAEAGLTGLVRRMAGWADQDPVWAVPDLLRRAALAGQRWTDDSGHAR